MNSILPNMRLLGQFSENRGEDWATLSLGVDDVLSSLGMDLAEEAVYLVFDRAPGAVLNHEGKALVARSVVGPKKQVEAPLQLIDWVSAPVHRKLLKGKTWESVLQVSYKEWENLQTLNQKTSRSFILCLRRKVLDALMLEIEVIFSE